MENIKVARVGVAVQGSAARAGMARRLLGVGFGCLLMIVGSAVRIPLPHTDVPMTLQLLAVLLCGLLLGSGQAIGATSLYLALGAAGLPVFAGTAGLSGPTGGYLAGFVAGAWVVSRLKGSREAGVLRQLPAAAAGAAVVFAFGLAGRILWLGGSWELAVATGLAPFFLKALVEVALAVAIVRSIGRVRVGRLSRS